MAKLQKKQQTPYNLLFFFTTFAQLLKNTTMPRKNKGMWLPIEALGPNLSGRHGTPKDRTKKCCQSLVFLIFMPNFATKS
jgi:hypothetical protein